MNMHTEENSLISKYLLGEATEEEIKTLFDWVDSSSKNREELIIYKKVWALSIGAKTENDVDYNKVQTKIKNLKNKRSFSLMMKYVAFLVVGAFITTVFFMNQSGEKNRDQIVLEMDNGEKKIIPFEANQDIVNHEGVVLGKQQQNKISYEYTDSIGNVELRYNTLYVPYAKRFHIILSDGSSIHLNSGTIVKFPVKFLKGRSREIFLDGEAFFDVVEDKENAFIVQANGLSTHVYGTKFNVSSYKNNNTEEVVLLEGSVGVQPKGKQSNTTEELLLKPNEIASLAKIGEIKIHSVDVANHVAWIDGVLMFKNERLEDVFKKLERHYYVSIQNNHAALNDKRFTGTFEVETIDEVLMSFSKHLGFTYKINKKKIIINT